MDPEFQLQLIRAVARGERPAFEELYQVTGPKLYGVAMQLMRSHWENWMRGGMKLQAQG